MRWLPVVLFLAPAPVFGSEATLFVENATGAEDLVGLLSEELPPAAFAKTATAADLIVTLGTDLRLEVRDQQGVAYVARTLEGDRPAAVRVAALLVVNAREAYRPPPPVRLPAASTATLTTTAAVPRPEPPAWAVRVEVGGGLGWWEGPATPRFVLFAGAGVDYGDFGLFLALSGARATVAREELEARVSELGILLEGRWSFWRPFGSFALELVAAVGLLIERIEARAVGFAGTPPEEVFTDPPGPVGRFGLRFGSTLFDLVRWRLFAGVQLQRSVPVVAPEGLFPDASLDRGVVAPWAGLVIGI